MPASNHPPRVPARAVLLFARAPREEAVAKRLPEPATGGRPGASRLFELTRARLASEVGAKLPDTALLLAGGGDLPSGARRIAQRGTGFGARLANAVDDAFGLGFDELVVVPGDVPGLHGERLRDAFSHLDSGSLVVGPSPDGGAYLLGLTRANRAAIANVTWCSPHTNTEISAAAARSSLRLVQLAPLADVDDRSDMIALALAPATDDELRDLLIRILAEESPERVAERPADPRVAPLPIRPERGPPAIFARA